MAVASQFSGTLIGYSSYTKEGKTNYSYYVLVTQKQNSETKLYSACELAMIFTQEESIKGDKLKYGTKVTFDGEFVKTKNGAFMSYSNISAD